MVRKGESLFYYLKSEFIDRILFERYVRRAASFGPSQYQI